MPLCTIFIDEPICLYSRKEEKNHVRPITQPALAILSILFFTGAWNDFLWPLIVLTSEEMFTLTLAIASFVGPYDIEYGTIMAGSFLGTLPILILFLAMQRQFIAGLTSGSLKG